MPSPSAAASDPGCNFSERKAVEICTNAKTLFPKSDVTNLLVKEAVIQLNTIFHTVETFHAEMNRLASQLPEYETVLDMTGVVLPWGRSS